MKKSVLIVVLSLLLSVLNTLQFLIDLPGSDFAWVAGFMPLLLVSWFLVSETSMKWLVFLYTIHCLELLFLEVVTGGLYPVVGWQFYIPLLKYLYDRRGFKSQSRAFEARDAGEREVSLALPVAPPPAAEMSVSAVEVTAAPASVVDGTSEGGLSVRVERLMRAMGQLTVEKYAAANLTHVVDMITSVCESLILDPSEMVSRLQVMSDTVSGLVSTPMKQMQWDLYKDWVELALRSVTNSAYSIETVRSVVVLLKNANQQYVEDKYVLMRVCKVFEVLLDLDLNVADMCNLLTAAFAKFAGKYAGIQFLLPGSGRCFLSDFMEYATNWKREGGLQDVA
ncbi:MAG: hypothetical protein JNK26_05385 [Candidatus Doudnabacteria bacterium]|nr:hypothetical protein [Candidatus Doudnabacteria bacterium]